MTDTRISVDVLGGPIGSCGFRSGNWTVTIGGKRGTFFASIPHACDLREQREILEQRALLALKQDRIKFLK